jgi:translation initiation factor 5A
METAGSLTYPQQASACRKGGFIMIKEHACKIIDMSTSKTGKHGHAKVKFTAADIFDGSKHEHVISSTHNVDVPNVSRFEYQLLFIDDEGFITLMLDNGEEKSDVQLDDSDELSSKIREMYEKEEDVLITLLCAIGREKVVDCKKINN